MTAAVRRSPLSWILAAGFGGLVLLMITSGWYVMSLMESLRQQEELRRRGLAVRVQALITFQNSERIFRHSPANALMAHEQCEHAIQAYPDNPGGEEISLLIQLQQALRARRTALASGDWIAVEPQSLQIESVLLQMQELQRKASLNLDRILHENFQATQQRALQFLLVTLAAGLGMALLSIVQVARLEREARRRFQSAEQQRQHVETLSRQMLDVQEQERRAIARELHDQVGQTLGALLMDAGRLSGSLASDRRELSELAANVKKQAEVVLSSVRDLSQLLRPSMLDDLGLVPALEWQAREASRRGSAEVEVDTAGIPDPLPEAYRTCIYRVAQEALRNVVRHANAHSAHVSLTREDGWLRLRVSDDGAGFDPVRTKGMGMMGMEERVRQLGGVLRIDSTPGKGTAITAELPWPPVE